MLRIITQQADAQTELRRIRDRFNDPEIQGKESAVREILDDVKRQGNQALLDYTEKLEQQVLRLAQLKISGSELDAAYQQVSKELLDAIQLACEKIEAFHRQRLPKSWVNFRDEAVIGKRYQPVKRAGIYVPDGNRAHLSLVLMQAIPAKVAQVSQIVMVTPPGQELKIHPGLLVAAQEAGITEIYRVGGPQAIAALAYGTETIPKVDVITGVGDIYVTLAKKMVGDLVKVDALFSPAELLIIADRQANPKFIASDLIAQAEQHPASASILLTVDATVAQAVQQEVHQQLQNHPQGILTEKAIAHYGLIIVVDSLEKATELADFFAPTHLELMVDEPWELLEQIHNAGTIFLGPFTPKTIGDYLGGSLLSLASSIGVETFLKSSNLIQYSPLVLRQLSSTLQILAQAEGFFGGADAIRFRNEGNRGKDSQ